jgi:hypothetical protein
MMTQVTDAISRPVTIYISAAADLMAERESLARMIAALPVTLAWRILQTPIREADPLSLEALGSAELYFLVIGSDIRAPVGLEWLTARRARYPDGAYLKRGVLRTPAGQVFIKDAGLMWQPFLDAADLSRQVQQVLAQHLVQHARRYILTPEEIAGLEALRASDRSAGQAGHGEEAGHSAVILSRERFEPGEGVVVDE